MLVAGDPSLRLDPADLPGRLPVGGRRRRGQPLPTTATSTRGWRAPPTARCPPGASRRARRWSSAARSPRCRVVELSLAVNPLAAALSFCGLPRLHARLHDVAQAPHAAEHRHRRRRRRGARRSSAGRRSPGGLDGTALYLFAIVFFWTPPHFWALSLLMKDEYAKVGVPMLPVVRGEAETRRQILLYSRAALRGHPAAVLRRRLRRRSTWSPRSCSAACFIGGAVRLYRRADRRSALRLYLFSLAYLAAAVRRDGRRRQALG